MQAQSLAIPAQGRKRVSESFLFGEKTALQPDFDQLIMAKAPIKIGAMLEITR